MSLLPSHPHFPNTLQLLIVASTQFSIKVDLGRVTMTFMVSLDSMGTSQSLSHSITGQYLSLLITPLLFKTCFILGLGGLRTVLVFPLPLWLPPLFPTLLLHLTLNIQHKVQISFGFHSMFSSYTFLPMINLHRCLTNPYL